jgi:pyruvate dehydrogenase E2 component (dihydrolipoamide acetyltransferase)
VPTEVIMPALGMAQETGKILRWLKAEGESVTRGEILLEIETDKVTAEVEAPATGILANVTATVGDEVPVGQVIAHILAPGESLAPVSPQPQVPAPATPASSPQVSSPPIPSPQVPASSPRVPASPRARRLAREQGVNLATLAGRGPGGAVLSADVAAQAAQAAAPSTTWRLMAERTTQTWTTVPHFVLARQVDATRLIAWRNAYQRRAGVEITYTDLLTRLVAAALRMRPEVNVRWEDGRVVSAPGINIGIAVATDDGLVVPVIHGADGLTLEQISRRRAEVVSRARDGRLRPEDLSGGTFTISNLGMFAVDAFVAVLNAPQAAILAVGRIADRVVAVGGQPAVRPVMVLTLSCDHRAVDGARAARFLETLSNLIEEPASLIE